MAEQHPKDNLVRAWSNPEAVQLRASTGGDGTTMFGHFAVFDSWTEIASAFEGNFLERIAPGAFKDTFRSKAGQIRVLYDHGGGPAGNMPLGSPRILREDATGAYYEVDLFHEASYVQDLMPAIRAGALGSSFRFKVTGEEWSVPQKSSASNPQRLDERTITGVDLYEFGPVTFPAYADATAGLRSRTDEFLERFVNDPAFVAAFIERVGARAGAKMLSSLPLTTQRSPLTSAQFEPQVPEEEPESDDVDPDEEEAAPDEPADGGETEDNDNRARRTEWLTRVTAGFDEHLARLERARNDNEST